MALNWRDAITVELTDTLIADPNAGHNSLKQLHGVRVAVEDGFLHIDPRKDSGSSQDLFMVPATAVHRAVYRETVAEPFMVEVQTG
ncbi:hypothetical protein [Streptomyces anulatus]|uniref:hypothetical protein n=1 Tax=Streptomyces anulatus TaxID=1892 RepID=UPI002E126E00|nr:hypothetical protein OG557_39000 [Streptomyces anulatus]